MIGRYTDKRLESLYFKDFSLVHFGEDSGEAVIMIFSNDTFQA